MSDTAATFASTDTLAVGMGSGSASFQITVELQSGGCVGHGQRRVGRKSAKYNVSASVTGEELDLLRADALKLHARGDFDYRDQFAQAGVSFVAVLNGVTVTADYRLDGGRTDFEDVYDILSDCVWDNPVDPIDE